MYYLLIMPGRPKKSKDGKEEDLELPLSQEQNLDQAESRPATSAVNTTSEFTKALKEALKDPEVKSGFVDLLWPKVATYVNESLKPIQDRIDDIDAEVAIIQEDIKDVRTKCGSSDKALESRIRELERQANSCLLRVTGLEPTTTPQEASLHNKYSLAFMNFLLEAGMTNVSESDFCGFKKINFPSNVGPHVTVQVKFVSQDKRDNVYKQRSLLKKCAKKLYINEELTRLDAKIFKKARKEVKEGTLVSCWTNSGIVWGKTTPDGKPFPIVE